MAKWHDYGDVHGDGDGDEPECQFKSSNGLATSCRGAVRRGALHLMAPVAVAPPPLRFSFQPLAGHKVRRGCGAQSPARKKRRIGCGAQSPARKKARIDKGVLTRLPKGGPRPSGPRAIVQRESGADHDTQPVSPAARVGPIPTLTVGPRSFMFWLSPSPSPSPSQPPPRASVPDAVMRPGVGA